MSRSYRQKMGGAALRTLLSLAMLISMMMPQAFFAAFALADDEVTYSLESDHNYANSMDETKTFTCEGATNGVYVTFNDSTKVESGYDYIYIYDGDDNLIGTYTGTTLAGVTIYVPTATVKIRLTSDSSSVYYGYACTITAAGEALDLSLVGTLASVAPVALGASIEPEVTVGSTVLTAGTDYTFEASSATVGTQTITVTGIGSYTGTLSSTFTVYDPDDESTWATGATITSSQRSLRMSSDTGTTYVGLGSATDAWKAAITSITIEPIESDGSATVVEGAEYPNAPQKMTLTSDDFYFSGSYLYFNRTESNPIIYVMSGHEPLSITKWGTTCTYNSQTYQITIEATGYTTTVGTNTWYTGTSDTFSIIIDEDGDDSTTADQTTAATWTRAQLEEKVSFANGSSQCGMTGFRTFSTEGVSLTSLLSEAGVTVDETDYFLLDTTDHYGNNFTYEELFGTTRYFMSAVYEEGFAETYASIVETDSAAGSTIELRKYLAEKAAANESTIEPRICTSYVETYVYASDVADAVLPTEENTTFNSLVAYENQYRFVYGIALVQEECTLTFDTNGGSEVESQTVLSHLMTSTANTTMWSSYWANSLVIYRGAGTTTSSESTAAEAIEVPETPTKEGYVFAGWYTDEDCTDGNEFDFEANDATIDVDTTLYAKWITASDVELTNFSMSSEEHDDADEELNQIIYIDLEFSDEISLTEDFDAAEDLYITIAGGDVANTAREVTASVVNGNTLRVKLCSTAWVAIYAGALTISQTESGMNHIVDSEGLPVVFDTQSGRIPIGIVVENYATAGTSDTAATTICNVAHKANMRGMYAYILVSIDAEGNETVIQSSTSHAHNFYSTITRESIASTMASGIDAIDGYSATYYEDTSVFVITADEAVEGETLAIRMDQVNSEVVYGTVSEAAVASFNMSNEEHDDADAELNQIIYIDVEFDQDITLSEDFDAAQDLYITIAGGDVANTAREVTASVVNGNTLRVKLCSTAWVAIYAGALTISQTDLCVGAGHIQDANGNTVVFDTQSGRIPIGIVVENYATAGTSDTAATTICNVAHKANMRGMFAYILVSIDAEGNETVIQSSTSHAHNFYTTITRESIASTMASGIDAIDGYSATYYEDSSVFVITADEAVEGETLAIRMDQVNSEVVYGTVSEAAVANFSMSSEEHDDADAELNQIIYIDVEFDQEITLSEDFDAAQDLYITIAGGDVASTSREVTASVVNGNTLRVKLCSTAWVAIYAGALTISQTDLCVGAGHIQDANGNTVVFDTQSGRIPIGIVVSNDATAGTASVAASTIVNVEHKANMRGMYAFILVSIDAEGNETIIKSSTSHAHNFYSSITKEYIASVMASAIDSIDGYSTQYIEGTTYFVMTADEAVEGQTIAIRMDELGSAVNYTTGSAASMAAAAQEAIDALEAEIADLEEEIAGLEAELAELEGAAEAYEAEIAELEEAVEAYEAEIADLEAKVAELEASGTADATTIATLKSTIESLESTVADYKSTIESLESTAATYKSMVDSLNSTISSMTTAAEAYTATIANLSASVSSLNTTIAEKEAEITALKAEIAELEASATADATTIATLKSTVSSLESAVEGYKTTISEQTTEISKLESQISTLKSEAETSSSTITSLKAQVASLESTITEMTTAATEASSTIASLQAQVATLQSTVESQKTTISTLEDTVSALESQVSDLTASSSEATKAAAAIASLFEDALTINVKSLTSKKAGKATLKWYKNAAADGYQITYKSGGKTKTIKVSYSKAKKVLKKLAKGKKVKVQIRAFAEVNGTTYYGAWSKTVKVKVKK